jgi:hypothetical protein
MNLLSSINNPIKSNLKPPIYVDISYSDPSGNTFTNIDNSFKTNLLFQNTCTLTINNQTNYDLSINYYIIGKGESGGVAIFSNPTFTSGKGGRGGRITYGSFSCPSGNNVYDISINNTAYINNANGGRVAIRNNNTTITTPNITNTVTSTSFFYSGGTAVSLTITGNAGSNSTTVFPDGKCYGGGGGSGGKTKGSGTMAGGKGGDYVETVTNFDGTIFEGGKGGTAKVSTTNQIITIVGEDGANGSKYGGGGGGGGHAALGDNSQKDMGVGGVGGNGAVFIYFKERHKII